MKQSKGITLVVLVVTIIVLLILAGISIQAFTGSGLFQKAIYAKEQAKLAELEEQMNLAITEMIAHKNGGKITIDDYIKHLTEKMNITDRYKGDGKQIIEVEGKYIFEIIDEDPYISVERVGIKDKLPPILKLSSIANTTNSITVKVTTKRNEGGKIEYYIKAEDEDKYVLRKTQADETNQYTYAQLEQNKKYNIKIVAIAKNKQTAEILVDKTTGDVPDLAEGDIIFTYEPSDWTNGSVKVTAELNIEMDSSYTLKITDSSPIDASKQTALEWTDASTGITVSTNKEVYAVLVDNEGQIGDAATGNVTNIDKTNPERPSIEVISGTEGENGYYKSDVQLKITQGQDGESGIEKVTYILNGAMTSNETEIINEGTVTITAEGTTTITAYNYDKANNKSEGTTYTIQKDSIAPTITLTQTNVNSREYSKTVTASVTDVTSQVQIKKYAYKSQTISYFANNGNTLGESFTVKTADNNGQPSFIYTVYAKDNAGNETVKTITLQNLLIDNVLTAKNGLCLGNGASKNDSTGAITLPIGSNAVQFGPYWNLPKGIYEITYTGSNLPTEINNYLSYVNQGYTFSPSMQSASSNTVVYRVTIPENAGYVEFTIYNGTSNVITINNIRIKQL